MVFIKRVDKNNQEKVVPIEEKGIKWYQIFCLRNIRISIIASVYHISICDKYINVTNIQSEINI